MTEPNELKEVVTDIEKEQAELGADPEDIETTDWKAEALKARGIAKRNATRAEKLKKLITERKSDTPVEPEKNIKKGFDYSEKAYLVAKGIEEDNFDFVQEVMQGTGKSLEEVLGNRYFQNELKERREQKKVSEAIPQGSKRGSSGARDQVEYWLAKGELPPAEDRELRQKVVNARIDKEKRDQMFTGRPIA